MRKIEINRPLLNFSENWLLVRYITNLSRIDEKLLNLSCPQGEIIDVKMKKKSLNRLCQTVIWNHLGTARTAAPCVLNFIGYRQRPILHPPPSSEY